MALFFLSADAALDLAGGTNEPAKTEGRPPAAFADFHTRTLDGVDVSIDVLHVGFKAGPIDIDGPIARLARRERGPVVVVGASGVIVPTPTSVAVEQGSVLVYLSLVAGPVHHDADDVEFYWRSRVTLLAVVSPVTSRGLRPLPTRAEPDVGPTPSGSLRSRTRPLKEMVESLVAHVEWNSVAEDADEMP